MIIVLFKRIINEVSKIAERIVFFIIGHFFIYFVIKEKGRQLSSSVRGHFNLVTEENFYKIAFKNAAFFFAEKNNFELVKRKFSQIGKMIPDYQYLSYFDKKINLMKTQRLSLISERGQNFAAAKRILNRFGECSLNGRCSIEKFPYLSAGLILVKKFYGLEMYEKAISSVKQFLESGQFRIGPCHGDFHHRNIMKINKDIYIIDLDCFREQGLQALDAVYYANQYVADDEKMSWQAALIAMLEDKGKYRQYHDFLENFLAPSQLKDFALIYCLDRLGQDVKYLTTWGIFPGKKLRDTLVCLANGKKEVAG